MPDDKARRSTKLFAEQVMPRLRHIWDDYEDHWSPKPVGDDHRAAPRRVAAAVGSGD